MNEKALFSLSYGLYVLTAHKDGLDNGCIINTAMQVTNSPNRISVTVNKSNYTTSMISATGKFNISVISEKAGFDLFKRFGFASGADVNKFDGFNNAFRTANGIMFISEGTNAYINCTVEQTVDIGTHIMFIASVDDCEILDDAATMTYSYYFANVKPKPQVQQSAAKVWVCKVCGYVYDDAKMDVKFEDLPADWVCPLCKHPKSDFELQ